jgi:hypothetical protein
MVVMPAQAENAGGIAAGRKMTIAPVNVRKCRRPGQRWNAAYDARLGRAPSAQLRAAVRNRAHIHLSAIPIIEMSIDADQVSLFFGQPA